MRHQAHRSCEARDKCCVPICLLLEKGITAAWRSPNGGGNSKTGWELQNRAWLPPIDRQAHDTHAQFFLPINFSANSAPQLILKILLVVSITVNLMSYYTMLQKMLTPKPTPHLTLTLTCEIGAEKKVCSSGDKQLIRLCDMRSLSQAVPFHNSPTGPHRTMAPF